jgi:hypothetical protein
MIPKSGIRFSDKIMLYQKVKARVRFNTVEPGSEVRGSEAAASDTAHEPAKQPACQVRSTTSDLTRSECRLDRSSGRRFARGDAFPGG